MKVYRGYNKEVGPISYDDWIYVTPDIEQAKWYATKNGDVKDGAIIEYDMYDDLTFLSLHDVNVGMEDYDEAYPYTYTIDDLLWHQEDISEHLYNYGAGIVFEDPVCKGHMIYILFDEKYLKNGRILSPEEFNSVKLRESFYKNELNDVLNRAGVKLDESVVDAMDVNGYTTYMYKNPTMKELRDDKEANGEFRVVRVNDDFFFGDAGYWIHDYMDDSDDAIRLFYDLNTNTFYEDFETIDANEYQEFYNDFVETMQEPYILNNFPNCKFKIFSKSQIDNDTPFGLVESANKGIDFIAYHGGVEPDMTPEPNRALYLTDSYELAHQFARREIWDDGLYEGEIPTVFTFKGHFNNPYYLTDDEYDEEGQDSNIDYQKWIDMGVDGLVYSSENDKTKTTYYIVIDLSSIKLVDKKVFYDEADLDDEELDETVDYNNIREKIFQKAFKSGELVQDMLASYDIRDFINNDATMEELDPIYQESGLDDAEELAEYVLENYNKGASREFIKKVFDFYYNFSESTLKQELSRDNKIYRIITSDKPLEEILEICKTNGIGNCWAKTQGHEYAYYGGSGKYDYVFEAEFQENDVDWEMTLYLRMIADYEDEIRLKKSAKIKVLNVEVGQYTYNENGTPTGKSHEEVSVNMILPVGHLYSY